MAYLIPPMDDEPPPEFLAFVVARSPALRSEAARLVGGDRAAPELSMQVLTDLAGHWRWLTRLGRLTRRDAAAEYLSRRLTARTKQWREDQIYPVEVQVLGDPGWTPADHDPVPACARPAAGPWSDRPGSVTTGTAQYQRPGEPPHESIAQQLADLLPSTIRTGTGLIADAEIAWVHAYRRYVWRRYCAVGGGIVLLVGSMVQFMSQFSTST